MKNAFFGLTILLGFGLNACAQSAPTAVTSAFQKKFPTAKSVEWDQENDTEWEAEFKMDGREYSANFSNDGVWKETEYEMKTSELPETIRASIKKAYPGYKIDEAESVEKPGFKGYELILEKGDSEIEILLDSSGTILSSKDVSDEEDEEE